MHCRGDVIVVLGQYEPAGQSVHDVMSFEVRQLLHVKCVSRYLPEEQGPPEQSRVEVEELSQSRSASPSSPDPENGPSTFVDDVTNANS